MDDRDRSGCLRLLFLFTVDEVSTATFFADEVQLSVPSPSCAAASDSPGPIVSLLAQNRRLMSMVTQCVQSRPALLLSPSTPVRSSARTYFNSGEGGRLHLAPPRRENGEIDFCAPANSFPSLRLIVNVPADVAFPSSTRRLCRPRPLARWLLWSRLR